MTIRFMKGALVALVSIWIAGAAQAQSVVEVIRKDPALGRFAEIVERSGLETRLSGPGPFTVFAPTDQALEELTYKTRRQLMTEPPAELQGFVLRHISSYGRQLEFSGDATRRLQALDGSSLLLVKSPGGGSEGVGPMATAEGAPIRANLTATNGWVHYLDGVLPPR
jgi:stabilin-1